MLTLTENKHGSLVADEDPGEPGTNKPRVSVTAQEALVLAALARGARVLEIGTGLGVSTKAMAKTAARVVTVDIDSWVQENVFPTLGGVACFADIAPLLSDRFDVIFIDGAHDIESVVHDIETAQSLLAKEHGVILLHDHKLSGVQKALAQLGLTPVVINTTHEIAMVFPQKDGGA